MSGSNKWGWSSNDPALCNSHLGCPAIYPNFLMAYEIIRLDRRPIWSVVCSTGKELVTKGERQDLELDDKSTEEPSLELDSNAAAGTNTNNLPSYASTQTRTVLHRDSNRLNPASSTNQGPRANTRGNAQRVELADLSFLSRL